MGFWGHVRDVDHGGICGVIHRRAVVLCMGLGRSVDHRGGLGAV